MEFKDRLKQLRESKGLTQKELADELNKLNTDLSSNSKIYTQTISYWENGRDPSIGMLIKIAQYFDVPTDYLLGKTDSVSIDEINFEYFSKYLSKQNIEKLIKNYPDNMKKAVYFLLSNYTSDIFTNFNNEKKQYEINLDFLYLITKAVDILKSFYDEMENKVLCYNTESSLQNVKYIDSISMDTLKDINKLKALTKIGLDSIVDKLEDLVLFCNDPSTLKLKDEILEYTSTNDLNKNYFSKHLKKAFTDLVNDVLNTSKYTGDNHK
ncbi:HTH-type transcriptional regulator ImmR [Clostridium ragsdalei P11]|uniref:HTH-type transcriptional regulator ImmR n=1 Tax=Clostridium ragsdalei P11 TaxID=1353534 RepID=A0A1A6ARU9_9CLOT|nr:helix-turn-helix transcriptional regulator [Clostridium ragsdalei]OBR92768.1 HTH-type transcriptional regulator ImmR [Clostridium ragsdalei P11]